MDLVTLDPSLTRIAPPTRNRKRRPLGRGLLAALSLALTLGSLTTNASAGGVEIPGLGARSLGRAGAWRARADSALALHLNPANLARLSGTNIELSAHLAMLNACFDRTGTARADSNGLSRLPSLAPDPDDTVFGETDDYADIDSPRVCNQGALSVVPQLAVTFRPHRRIGIGIGVTAPNSPSSGRQFGASDGSIASDEAPNGRLPSPVRYDLVKSDVLLAFINAGIGIELHPRVRVGASFGWGFARIDFTTTAAPTMGEAPATDLLSTLSASDGFIPRVGLSIAAEPIDGLDIMMGYTWIDRVHGNGTLRLRSMHFATEETQLALAFPNSNPSTDRSYPVVLDVPLASSLSFGTRWAMLRNPRRAEPGVEWRHDPMTQEVFDIELGVTVTFGNVVDAQRVTPRGDPSMIDVNNRLDTGLAGVTITSSPELELIQNWQTQVSLSLGGDYNVVPGRLALRLGVMYESDGVPDGYERLSFMPWSRFGVALGATVRVNTVDLTMGYMHAHWFSRSNTEESARTAQTTLTGGNIISAGRYKVSANLVSLAASLHFP